MAKAGGRSFKYCGSELAIAVAVNLFAVGGVFAQSAEIHFDIPAENTAKALIDFSKQANVQILYPYAVAAKHDAPAIKGDFTRDEGLDRILAGSGLEVASASGTTISLRESQAAADKRASAASTEVIVTGSRIRNTPPTSPSRIVSRSEIEQQGFAEIGDLVRSLPEDFEGGQNPGVMGATLTSLGNQNLTNASSINLRGLGSDATLVLLNDHRMSTDSFLAGVDVSAIPMSAVQRVEIVPDGASAIYGSDAVAGVVNFIMRKDFNGTEVSARVAGASQGGADETTYSVLSGWAGRQAHVLADVEYSNTTAVTAGERSFAAAAPAGEFIFHPQKRKSLFVSAGDDISDTVSLSFDGLISDRQAPTHTQRTATTAVAIGDVFTPSYDATFGAEVALWGNWKLHATANASGGRNETWSGATKAKGSFSYMQNGVRYGEINADGTLLELPSGDVKAAVGGGYRTETFQNNRPGSSSYYSADRQISYAYAEAYAPLVQPSSSRFGLNELDINLSGRVERYSDFGSTANPKIGLRYVPISDLTLRASWGTSFKAPTFAQMYGSRAFEVFTATGLGYSGPGNAVLLQGGNPDLKPEKSRSWTLGGEYKPSAVPTLTLSATYFNIDYRDRVVQPVNNVTLGLSSPLYSSFLVSPTAGNLASLYASSSVFYNFSSGAYNPSSVVGIVDDTYTNATSQKVHGVDAAYKQTFSLGGGSLNTFANATWLHLDQQTIPTLPAQVLSGTLFAAPDFKARGGATWQVASWAITGAVNFIDSEKDTDTTALSRIASWTTTDATIVYRFSGGGFEKGLKLIASASNLFDKAPPHAFGPTITYPGLGFDSTNASILGRYLSLTLVKAW